MTGHSRITIRVNGTELHPWDPFLSRHPSTQNLGTEHLPFLGQTIAVTPWVLPHRSKLTEQDQAWGGGTKSWNQHQGFYLYRSNRLLVQGDWLGLGFTSDEHTKLARIQIDFPASLDHEWQVDVKKSSARAPGALQADLRRIASATRRQAEEVYRHRGKIIARKASQEFVLAWNQVKSREGNVTYQINREHPAIRALLKASGDNRPIVNRTLRFIEETVPTTLIGVSISTALDTQPIPFAEHRPELLPLFQIMFDALIADGLAPLEAVTRIAAAEPFTSYPELIQQCKESL
jgi:hypothetical protein